MSIVECVKIDKATGKRVEGFDIEMKTPKDVDHKPHAWIPVRRDPKPTFNADTHKITPFNRKSGDEWVIGWKVKKLTAKEKKELIKFKLQASDKDMARAAEDFYELVVNNVPLPQEVIDRIKERQKLRGQL